jgi:ribose transport system substrate-binding protein/D-allose transport system substrate-binding protein
MALRSASRRLVLTLGAGTAAVALAACGGNGTTTADSTDTETSAAAAGGGNVAAVIKGLDNPFFQSMEAGIQDEAEASSTDVSIQAATSITDTSGQADRLTSLAGQDFGCFIVNPISGTNLVQGIAQIAAAGVPIVNIDSPVEAAAAEAAGADIATYIGTDNVEAGQLAGEQMAELLPEGGKVALIGGIAGDVTSGARLEGFEQGIPANIEIVQTVAADWDRQTALTRATDILRANPDLAGFFAANDDMGLGIVRAVANEGRAGEVKVISVDGNRDAFESVKAGELDATVAQFPYVIGTMGLQACQAAIAGETLPESVNAPVQVVTTENVDAALENAPKPGDEYDNPFADLLGQ